jgi:hypothetical protein
MLLLIALLAFCSIGGFLPRLLADIIATVVALAMVTTGRRAAIALADYGRSYPNSPAAWNRSVTPEERRLLRKGMEAALDNAQITSLLPSTTLRAYRIAGAFRG